jgi:hypothetical protein
MPVLEEVKKIIEKGTGWSRPSERELEQLLRDRKANAFRFKDGGLIPNHPKWPLVVYRGALRLGKNFDPAAVFEELFESHGWGDSLEIRPRKTQTADWLKTAGNIEGCFAYAT